MSNISSLTEKQQSTTHMTYVAFHGSKETTHQEMWAILLPWFNLRPHGHIGPHSNTILVCQGPLPLPLPMRVPMFVRFSWQCLSSLSLADLVLSWILEPPSIMLGVVIHLYHMTNQCSLVLWVCPLSFVVQFLSWLLHLLPCLSQRQLICFLCHLMWWAASSHFIGAAVNGHNSALYTRVNNILLTHTAIILPLNLSFCC